MDDKEIVTEEQNEEIAPEVKADAEAVVETAEEAAPAKKKRTKKPDPKIAELEKAVGEKDAEIAELNDRYLRMMAEYDNFRKRSAKEREAAYADAYNDALKAILPIIDNLERAVGISEAEAVLKGLEMTLKGAEDALSKIGVESFGSEGEQFDPNMHNAVMMVDSDERAEGEIVSVFQKGYRKGDKIIRYAMVTVAN